MDGHAPTLISLDMLPINHHMITKTQIKIWYHQITQQEGGETTNGFGHVQVDRKYSSPKVQDKQNKLIDTLNYLN